MHHGDRQLLFIRLGHLVLETPLGDAAPDNLPRPDVDDIEYRRAIFIRFHRWA